MSDGSDDLKYLSQLEAEEAINAISDADWKRLASHCRFMSAGLPDTSDRDLLHEAVVRVLATQKHWKRGVTGFTTLFNAMRSIASDTRKRAKEGPIDRFAVVDDDDGADDEDEAPLRRATGESDANPEDVIIFRQTIRRIEELVDDNVEEKKVLQCWAHGMYGKAAAAELKMDEKTFDAARNRLNRKIAQVKKEGQ